MNCPGSNVLLKQLKLPETDEEDYRREGVAAHEAAAECLVHRQDAWEVVGEKFHDTEVDAPMADAIQVYLDYCNSIRTDTSQWYVEYKISNDARPNFYGTADFANIDFQESLLDIVDYKHGEGIPVEAFRNPQIMYYAVGVLTAWPEIRRVHMSIVQPRCYHNEGPIRVFEMASEDLIAWANAELFPAMERAEIDETLDTGSWCRFCPAKLFCPTLTGAYKGAALANPKIIPNLSDDALAREYKLREAVKFYLKAQEDEVYRRLCAGKSIPTAKLVFKRADRVWKAGWEKEFAEFGEQLKTTPEFKSPAQVEKLSPSAKTKVKEWAYMPQTGLTVAYIDDKRMAAPRPQTASEAFSGALAKITEAG